MCPLQLPEDLASVGAKFENEEALARGYAALEAKLGTTIPAPNSAEERAALLERLGAPKEASAYEAPLGVEESTIENLRTFAVAAKLTPEQFETMAKSEQKKVNEAAGASTEAVGRVRTEYGDQFDAAQARVVRALQHLGDKAADYDASEPTTFRLLEQMGSALQGPGQAPGTTPQATPASAGAAGPDAKKLARDARAVLSSEAYNSRFHEEHQIAKDTYAGILHQLLEQGYDGGAFDTRLEEKSAW